MLIPGAIKSNTLSVMDVEMDESCTDVVAALPAACASSVVMLVESEVDGVRVDNGREVQGPGKPVPWESNESKALCSYRWSVVIVNVPVALVLTGTSATFFFVGIAGGRIAGPDTDGVLGGLYDDLLIKSLYLMLSAPLLR